MNLINNTGTITLTNDVIDSAPHNQVNIDNNNTNLTAIKAYGLDKEYKIGGVPVMSARRATFLIDKEGKVTHEQVDNEAVDPTKIIDACQIPEKKGS